MKNLCTTHMFHYSGNKCPFCEKERIEKLCKRLVKTDGDIKPVENKKKSNEITMDDLERLKAKFNS